MGQIQKKLNIIRLNFKLIFTDFGKMENFSSIYLPTDYPWRPQNTQLYLQFIEKFDGKMRIWILHHQQTIRFIMKEINTLSQFLIIFALIIYHFMHFE